MLTLQKAFKYEGALKDAIFPTLTLNFTYPNFSYQGAEGVDFSVSREVVGVHSLSLSHELSSASYKLEIPAKDMIGSDAASAANFASYMRQALMRSPFDIEDIAFDIDVSFSDAESGIRVGGQTFGALFFLKGGDAATRSTVSGALAPGLPSPSSGISASNVVLLSRHGYDDMFAEYKSITGSPDEAAFIFIVRQLMAFLNERNHLLSHVDEAVLGRLTSSLSDKGVANAQKALDILCKRFDKFFDFTIRVPEIKKLEMGGTFTLKVGDGSEITREDLNLYDISAEYSMLSSENEAVFSTVHVDWTGNSHPLENNSIVFSLTETQAIIFNAVQGPVSILVKDIDGAVVWSKTCQREDPVLKKLKIETALQRPGTLSDTKKKGAINKKLRGKLIAINSTASLKDVTVLVQAKKEGDQVWRVVSAAETDAFGNFSMSYPFGAYVAAQAIVALTPNSPADIPVGAGQQGDQTISDDFLYLLVKDVQAPQEAAHEDDDGECGCTTSPTQVPRLPDHSDLINSNEYSQDIGGSCVNLSTPHRTLREFNYQAIVRTSDPDVSNYTLRKMDDGSFELTGGASKIKRAGVDLNNPVMWQDAPDSHSNLSLYQAVTVATGHILHYKSEFKADGYSLGDLLYSLPLAPGQKKQIVVIDSSHSLRAKESQSLTQGERLAANLTDDREIATQLGGGINESLRGSSDATTSGVSAGLGAAGSAGFFGASLGVAGGYANANSQASQNSGRNVSQYFGEKLRQSIMQNADSYRQQNASVVTTVQEGQHYAAETEVIANHNHCHALTMMYFEVLRHYAIYQELTNVEECVFVPLLMTNFTTNNICKWRDVLARHLLPMHANTYLQPFNQVQRGRAHPLLKAFDANDRIRSNYANVDFPTSTYDDEVINFIKGEVTLRVNLPRPKTRYDRVKSLPIISQTVTHEEVDGASAAKSAALAVATGGLSLLLGDDGSKTVSEQVLARAKIFDAFMQLDANYATVPPAKCMRVTNFRAISIKLWGTNLTITGADFFEESILDKKAWTAYATILGYNDVLDMMEYYFKDRLIAEWDSIFYNDIVPVVFQRIVNAMHLEFIAADWTNAARYKGGEHLMHITMNGSTNLKRNQFPLKIKLSCSNSAIKTIADQVTLVVDKVRLNYSTSHYNGVLFAGRVGDDLLDDTMLFIPENADEKRSPRKEDIYLVEKLIEHLNSNIEHYNKALWASLDADRRFMLLDGFNIQIFNEFGQPTGYRSLASVVKNHVISIVGNALVLPVAAGYKISKSYIVEQTEDGSAEDVSLVDHYKPTMPVPPYRISVPSRGVFLEAVKASCNACEPVEDNTSQDWTKFTTDEPTPISPLTAPTPTITDWKAAFKDFATPIVNIQNAPTLPAPGAGLAGLNDLLGKADIFKDITGLQGNQDNVMRTYLSNQENVRALAETAKGLTMQDHNTSNSDKIMSALKKAKDTGGINQQEYGGLLKTHLQQLIDGGDSQKADAEKAKPSLTEAAVKAAEQGKNVTAQKVGPEGTAESIMIEGGAPEKVLAKVTGAITILKQANPLACWATVATMMVNWQKAQNLSVPDVLAGAGAVYLQKFNNMEPLMSSEKPAFLSALGMVGETPSSYTLQQYIDWMNTYGPLWVTTDSLVQTGSFGPHARILTKISGTGSPDGIGTSFTFINPLSGASETETFAKFISVYEQMVTDNPTDKLFVQIVHFGNTVTGGGVLKASANEGGEGGSSTIDNDPRRLQLEVASQLTKYAAYGPGTTCKVVADYVKGQMAQVWNGKGGIVGMVDHGNSTDLAQYLGSSAVPAPYASVASTATPMAGEAFAEWDTLAAGKDPGTWAYTRNFTDSNLAYCVVRFFKLTTPAYQKDYFPILAHEICHFILYASEALIENDTRDFLFDPVVAQADKALGAKARNRFIQEVLGRRLNYLVHKEIDTPATPDTATPANIGKCIYEWAKTDFSSVPYYKPISDFLNTLPTVAQRRNQVGIWLQNFWSKVEIFENTAFATKISGEFNLAGEFLKKSTDAEYNAETSQGIH